MTAELQRLAETRSALVRTGVLDVEEKGAVLRVSRVRKVPSRGLFRLFIPRVVAVVKLRGEERLVRIRPDAVAWFMLVMIVGGVVVELFADRATHPRTYPPEFIFGLAIGYALLLVIEVVRTQSAVRGALDAHRGP